MCENDKGRGGQKVYSIEGTCDEMQTIPFPAGVRCVSEVSEVRVVLNVL